MFIILLLCGFAGIYAHWYNRWYQARTCSTFFEYLGVYRERTIATLLSVFASCAVLYQSAPDNITLTTLLTAFTTAYGFDSVVNKDKPVQPLPQPITGGCKQ